MRRVCAWCLKDMGAVENSSHPDTEISHGICEKCLENIAFQGGVSLRQYLDTFPVPIVAVELHSGRTIVRVANKSACEKLHKEEKEMVQHLSGNVFECAHSRLPEGCGRTIHCTGCAIRRAVMKTFETGEPLSMVPATLKRDFPEQSSSVSLYVSTLKVDNIVILRLDRMEEAELK